MNGVHDCGGMDGMGPIDIEKDEPVFHDDWERRMFAVMIATFAGGNFVVDEFRHAIERMGNAHYLDTPYYEHWMASVETLLKEQGKITEEEIQARMKELAA